MTIRLIPALFLLFLLPVQAAPPTPLLWQVSDDDNSVYLLGSFHFLTPDDYPLAASVDKAFEDAETVYFEISPEDMNDPEQAKKMFSLGLLEGGRTLRQSVNKGVWEQLEKYCSANGIPPATFQPYKPWLAGLIISISEMQKYGLQGELGLDRYFMDRAERRRKQVAGLETLGEQFALFDGLNAEEQEQFLSETLKEAGNSDYIKELHKRWRNGDAEGLWRLATKDMIKKAPGFYRSFVADRNNAWFGKISTFIKENSRDDALVVVGSLHLLGGDGLVSLLKKEGYRIRRLP
ncbi:MAG: TraB/GumN family protein [Gammaproteobacteria bacterium]